MRLIDLSLLGTIHFACKGHCHSLAVQVLSLVPSKGVETSYFTHCGFIALPEMTYFKVVNYPYSGNHLAKDLAVHWPTNVCFSWGALEGQLLRPCAGRGRQIKGKWSELPTVLEEQACQLSAVHQKKLLVVKSCLVAILQPKDEVDGHPIMPDTGVWPSGFDSCVSTSSGEFSLSLWFPVSAELGSCNVSCGWQKFQL